MRRHLSAVFLALFLACLVPWPGPAPAFGPKEVGYDEEEANRNKTEETQTLHTDEQNGGTQGHQPSGAGQTKTLNQKTQYGDIIIHE